MQLQQKKKQCVWLHLSFCSCIMAIAVLLLPIIRISFEYCVLNSGCQMKYFPLKLIEHNSFTYKEIPKPVFGDAKGHEHGSHQYKKDTMIYYACQPNIFFQTTYCYAVPFSPNTSENASVINLGNTLLDTSTYTVSHGIQEQTPFATSVSGNNFSDIVTNGTNEDTAQTPVTNSSQLNSSRHLPTNGIQEDTLQNVGPGNDQISTPTDSISDETQEADRTSASADTQLDPVSDTASYRSQEELDQTLAEQLRLGTLTGNIWSLCLYRVTEIERCDISSDKTSTEVAGNLFMSSFKSQHISEEIDVRTSIKRSKGLSNRVLNNVPGEREPLVSKNNDPEKQTDRKYKNNKKEDVQNITGGLQEKLISLHPKISKLERPFNEKGMKNEVSETSRKTIGRSSPSDEDTQDNMDISRVQCNTAQQPVSDSEEENQSHTKNADNLNNQDDTSSESATEDP